MFERQMMISGLEKQQRLLAGLIQEIEIHSGLRPEDWNSWCEQTLQVARNLRKLRKIKTDYFRAQGIYTDFT